MTSFLIALGWAGSVILGLASLAILMNGDVMASALILPCLMILILSVAFILWRLGK